MSGPTSSVPDGAAGAGLGAALAGVPRPVLIGGAATLAALVLAAILYWSGLFSGGEADPAAIGEGAVASEAQPAVPAANSPMTGDPIASVSSDPGRGPAWVLPADVRPVAAAPVAPDRAVTRVARERAPQVKAELVNCLLPNAAISRMSLAACRSSGGLVQ